MSATMRPVSEGEQVLTDDAAAGADAVAGAVGDRSAERDYSVALAVAVVVGVGLALSARAGASALLVAVAVVQALLAFCWLVGTDTPGRKGALIIGALAAAGADVAASVWPQARLGTLLAVFGLAIPVMFVHQLMRGAARARIVQSLGAVALLVIAEISLASLLQLRHEFTLGDLGGPVVAGVVTAALGALVVGYLVDLLYSYPRFDPEVPRGLLAVLASAGLGGSVGYLMLQSGTDNAFIDGRGAFVGASLGALIALLAVGAAFIDHALPAPESGPARRLRPVLGVLLPLSVLAPVAFLLCVAIRA